MSGVNDIYQVYTQFHGVTIESARMLGNRDVRTIAYMSSLSCDSRGCKKATDLGGWPGYGGDISVPFISQREMPSNLLGILFN